VIRKIARDCRRNFGLRQQVGLNNALVIAPECLNGGFRLIFRVPEYSELSIHTGIRSRSDQEGWVTKLGIFLSANLAAAVEVVDD
jgi:hypothetical protein